METGRKAVLFVSCGGAVECARIKLDQLINK